MAAFVNHVFKKGFILDEERLRKIVNIINKRLQEQDQNFHVGFKVYRADDFYYTTDNIDTILSEENLPWEKIRELIITAEYDQIVTISLDFDIYDYTRLKIEGEDRDFIYLLFSEIKTYASNEVNVVRPIRINPLPILITGMIAMLLLFYYMISSMPSIYGDISISNETLTIEDKLDYLIQREVNRDRSSQPFVGLMSSMIILAIIMMIATLLSSKFNSFLSYMFPSNIFLFGKEIIRFNRRLELRSKIIWGGIISFIMSLLSSIVWWAMTPKI